MGMRPTLYHFLRGLLLGLDLVITFSFPFLMHCFIAVAPRSECLLGTFLCYCQRPRRVARREEGLYRDEGKFREYHVTTHGIGGTRTTTTTTKLTRF